MFKAAELGRKVSKSQFATEGAEVRTQLLVAQRKIKGSQIPVIILIAGVQGAGKGEVVNQLKTWFDSRGVETHAFWAESDEEREYPPYWRYWRTLPPRGEIGIFFAGWYGSDAIMQAYDNEESAPIDAELNRIVELERMLTADGALIIKLWFHLARKEQKERIKQLSADQRSYWKMAPQYADKKRQYKRFLSISEKLIRATDTGVAPWYIIEATDRRYRDLKAGSTVLHAIERRLSTADNGTDEHAEIVRAPRVPADTITVLDKIDLTRVTSKPDYERELNFYHTELNQLAWESYRAGHAAVLVFQGWDASGKGGVIRRLSNAIDARLCRVVAVAAPNEEERLYHYLWRFWRRMPRRGRMVIFDRSWYGRVLVERVEGFASDHEWRRAYREINSFEEQLIGHGIVLIKFWLHIDKDEQLHRFEDRQQVPYKRHKITEEDWRNRDKWDLYEQAVNEMVARTSTEYAPWHLIAGNDKRSARIEVLKTVYQCLKAAIA